MNSICNSDTCFAEVSHSECLILTEKICNTKRCSFYKTQTQHEKERAAYPIQKGFKIKKKRWVWCNEIKK